MELNEKNSNEALIIYGEQMLAKLLDQIWNVFFAVTILAGAASLFRYTSTGWKALYSLHIALAVFFWACFALRKKLSFDIRAGILLTLFYIVGIGGLFSFGLVGAGAWWLVLCALLAKIFYSYRAGVIHAGICLMLILVAGYAYTTGMIVIPFDANEYITSISTWATIFFGCVFISLFIFSAIATYQRALLNLLHEFVQSKKKLEENLHELNKLRELIPICAECKSIRDDRGYWESVEAYMEKNASVTFSHCLCPPCGKKLYGDAWDKAMQSIRKQSLES